MHRGNSYARMGEFEAAITDFSHASELAPEFADIYAGLGSVYDQMGEAAEALAYYQQYLELTRQPDAAIVTRVTELEAE
jgi:tetratricopeptide (TPR) repeat protein